MSVKPVTGAIHGCFDRVNIPSHDIIRRVRHIHSEFVIIVMLHHLHRRGGQERSTLEILTRLAAWGWKIEVYSFSFEDGLPGVPVHWHRVPGARIPIQWVKNFWYRWYVARAMRMRKPATPEILVSLGTAALRADVRIIQFVHAKFLSLVKNRQLMYPNPKTILHRAYQAIYTWHEGRIEKKYLPRCEALIAISDQVRADCLSMVRDASQIFVKTIPHAIDKTTTRPQLPLEIQKLRIAKQPLILFVGALERKGIEKALCCLSRLCDLNWQFWVLGKGDIRRWTKQASHLGIVDRVTFFGERPSAPFFAQADIFFLPSIYEPFGLAVAEAISHGCVPLASRECGALELWPRREKWLDLSCFDSEDRWVHALRRLLEDRSLRDRCANEARESAQDWTWEKAAAAYAETFTEVMGRIYPDRSQSGKHLRAHCKVNFILQ